MIQLTPTLASFDADIYRVGNITRVSLTGETKCSETQLPETVTSAAELRRLTELQEPKDGRRWERGLEEEGRNYEQRGKNFLKGQLKQERAGWGRDKSV